MLRDLLIVALFAVGALLALRGPFYALLLYLWIAYFRPEDWVWNDFVRSLSLSWFVGVYVLISFGLSRERMPMSGRTALLFMFLAHSLVSTLFSSHFTYAWPYWVDFAKSLLITYLIVALSTDRSRFRLVLLVIALSLGLEAAKQGWVELFLNPGAKNYNDIAHLGSDNEVAVGMFMLVPVLGALARTTDKRSVAYLLRFIMIGVLYRGLVTYSRGGFLACGVMALLYFLRTPGKLRYLFAVVAIAALILPVLPTAYWERMETIGASPEERDTSSKGRLHFWDVALVMANDRPILGVGHNAFNAAYDTYDRSGGELYGTARSVHSAWFGLLAELGYPGLLMFLTILALALRACSRVRRRAVEGSIPNDLGEYATALSTSLAVFAVGGTFLTFQYKEILWHFAGLALALEGLAVRTAPAEAAEGEGRPLPVAKT